MWTQRTWTGVPLKQVAQGSVDGGLAENAVLQDQHAEQVAELGPCASDYAGSTPASGLPVAVSRERGDERGRTVVSGIEDIRHNALEGRHKRERRCDGVDVGRLGRLMLGQVHVRQQRKHPVDAHRERGMPLYQTIPPPAPAPDRTPVSTV